MSHCGDQYLCDGVPIQVTQGDMAMAFSMSDEGLSDEHANYPATMLIPNDTALGLPLHERLLHLFVSLFLTYKVKSY